MTNAQIAILSLIAESDRYGYEIETLIEERGMREWTEIGFSSIYYLLKKLDKGGLITSRLEEAAQGPARKVYHITPEGIQQLRAAVIHALSVPHPGYPPLLMGLANLPLLTKEEIILALEQHLNALNEQIIHVAQRQAEQPYAPDFVHAMFDYSLTMLRTQQTWLREYLNQLKGV